MKRSTIFSASVLSALVALGLTACTPTGPGAIAVAPSAARDGTNGGDGPFGAARITLATQARVNERVSFDVTFPCDATGALRRDRGPFATVVFVSGGLVAPERYRWIAEHIATRGFVVVSSAYVLNLALFQADNAHAALRAVREAATVPGHTLEGAVSPTGRVIAVGHSLGGIVATYQWLDHRYDGLALIASYPADTSRLLGDDATRTLFISGAQDGLVTRADLDRGFSVFRGRKLLALVDGMNHFDWTDQAQPSELSRDNTPTRPQAASRRDALRVIDAFTDAVLANDAMAITQLDTGTFSGVTVQR
jgi:alpha-beta hydrolase superfamily lysophospholipase